MVSFQRDTTPSWRPPGEALHRNGSAEKPCPVATATSPGRARGVSPGKHQSKPSTPRQGEHCPLVAHWGWFCGRDDN